MRDEKGRFKKGYKPTIEQLERLRTIGIGHKIPNTLKQKLIKANTGQKYMLGHRHTEVTKEKIRKKALNRGHTIETRKKISDYFRGRPNLKNRGERSSLWKGGITPINRAIRSSIEYEQWRTKVFERDLYTCQECEQVGGYLEADHIKPFSLFVELRFDVNNGRTLCKLCHRKTDTYGAKMNKYREGFVV